MPHQMGGTGARAAASPTGKGAAATGKRKLTVTGGRFSVTFRVTTTVIGGYNNDRIFSSNSVGSPRKRPIEGTHLKLSKLITVRSST